jgi:DNA repair exonuclease SbcCD ATPase subunit
VYHGMVSGSILDNGVKTEDGISISSFNGYDISLLGDIHRRQFLNKEKTIAYPGSLVQQNFKEELKHGVLRWDLTIKKSEFVVLENDYSFIDIPVCDELDLSSINFTKYSRIRLLIDNLVTEQKVSETLQLLEKYTRVIGIKKHMKEIVLKKSENTLEDQNVDSHEIEILKSFVEDSDNLEEVLNLHNEMLKDVDQDEIFSKSLPWGIEKIEFRNIFSYGDDILNVIDLKKGVTGILANNASGKTNVLNTIMYGLFGSSRTQNHLNKNIISRFSKKEDLLVRLTIKMGDSRYYIERTAKSKTRSRIKSSEAGQIDVVETLKFFTDSEILNLSSKTDTEKLLRDTLSILGKEEFVMTNMMSNISYGSTMSIISMTGTQFDEVFNNIFNLNKYTILHKNSKNAAKKMIDNIKTYQVTLETLKGSVKDYNSEAQKEKIEKLHEKIKTNKECVVTLVEKISDIDSKLLSLKATGTSKSKESLEQEINEYDEIIDEYDGKIQSLVDDEDKIMVEYENTKSMHKKELTRGPGPSSNVKYTQEELNNMILSQESSKQKVEFDASITNDYIKAKKYLKSVESESTLNLDEISMVIDNLEWFAEKGCYLLPKDVKEKMKTDFSKTYIDPNLLLKYKKTVEDKENRDRIIAENIKIEQNISKYKKLLSDRKIQDAYAIKNRLITLTKLMDYIDAFHDKNEALIELKMVSDNTQVNTFLKEKTRLNKELDGVRELLKNFEMDLYSTKREMESCEKVEHRISDILPKIQKLSKDLEIYKIYIEATHQKNLPKRVISNVIKNITDDANRLIYNTTGLLCEIQENDKWEVVVKKGDLVLGPEHCSGYERFMINTSLKISFDKYKQLSSIKIFMIDETIDCVSESNLDQIDVLLECLYRHYDKVILISHNEDLKKKIDNRIDIQINKKVSSIAS